MTAVLLFSLVLLLGALGVSLWLLIRSGETRVAWLAAAFAFMALRQAMRLWDDGGAPLAFDAASAAELAGLAASACAGLVLLAVWRTLGERNRVEALHWNSMEAVRVLGELATRPALDLDAKMAELLEIGCARFGLEIGVVSRVRRERYEVAAIRATEDFPITRGIVFPLAETWCGATLKSERPVAFERAGEASWAGDPLRSAFPFESYLGAAVRGGDRVFGTLCFGSALPRRLPFTATEKDVVTLMARWLGNELEHSEAFRDSAPEHIAAKPLAEGWREMRVPRGVDLNALLRRLDRRIQDWVGAGVDVELRTAPDLPPASAPRVPLESIVRSLVGNAVDAMPDGGRVVLETRCLEVDGGEPGVVPAVAPNRYVTLSVRDTGSAADADSLSRAFESDASTRNAEPGGEDGRLPLSSVYRILQRCGGDLSASVEPGSGSTFTVFLPLVEPDADEPSVQPKTAADAGPVHLRAVNADGG